MPDNVTVTNNLAEALAALLQNYSFSQLGVVVDENTERACYPLVQPLLPEHTVGRIRSGERHKNQTTCTQLWEWMTEARFDRQALVINLGGGVIGDMGGFCAATYKRGIRFVNLPTTLLSQVDASVGGKLGIDFQGYKNHIGLFQDPLRVIIHPKFLETLPPAELRSGFAEVIKHSLIADADYWPTVRRTQLNDQDWPAVIAHSVALKAKVVAQDFREGGVRKILNFGHTIGHAVESYYLDTDEHLLHGEAVAVGMVAETYLSQKFTGLPADQVREVIDLLLATYGHRPVPEAAVDPIVSLAQQDKKNNQSRIQCTLLEKIGAATFDVPITAEDIREAVGYYNKADEAR
ncbi:MAG: 3-dehydroquinate synthase [Tunicatimonas sp.]